MTLNPVSTQKLTPLEPLYCPPTGKLIVAEKHQNFVIPNGMAAWFHCEACQGWHIVIDNNHPHEVLRDYPRNDN